MKNLITIGLPSKGRLREGAINFFRKNNYKLISNGGERNYFARFEKYPNITNKRTRVNKVNLGLSITKFLYKLEKITINRYNLKRCNLKLEIFSRLLQHL